MDQLYDTALLVAAILGSAGVLLAGVHWAVSGAIRPICDDMSALRNDMSALGDNVHKDLRQTGERLARVEATIDATKHRIDQIEVRGTIYG